MYRRMTPFRLLATIVMLVIIGGYYGVSMSISNKLINRCSGTTTGVVTNYTVRQRHGRRLYRGNIETVDVRYEVKGITYTCSGMTSGHKEIGSHVTVYYNPSSPSEAFADKGPKLNNTGLYIAVGLGVTASVILMVIDPQRREQRSYF